MKMHYNKYDIYLNIYYRNLMKWNISVIRGKETKKYSVSTGEGCRKKKLLAFGAQS